MDLKKGLTVTADRGAVCGLYPNVPAKRTYQEAIDPQNAIPPTRVTSAEGVTTYYYEQLEPGVYHCGASMEGYCSMCRTLLYTPEKARDGAHLDMTLTKLAGNGFEAGYVMHNTQEFNDAQLPSGKTLWGKEYEGLFATPQFLRPADRPGRHQQTTNQEMMDFITGLDAANGHMHLYSLGKSPKYGYEMPLVLFTHENVEGLTLEQAAQVIRGNGKPTVQYCAQCHSSEPASTEGALAMMLQLCGDYGASVLDKVDVYIIPRINLDGAFHACRRSPTTGDDMNRDYMRQNNAEIRAVVSAYNLFLPEVAIDGHEKFSKLLTNGDAVCNDMELQMDAGALNHPKEITELALRMGLAATEKARSLGLRSHFYGTLATAAGGTAGSSYFGTRNSLSFLVETPGQVHLGMCFMERRVLAQYVLASTVISFTAENAQLVLDTVHSSRALMAAKGGIYDEADKVVLNHEKLETGSWVTPLVHIPSGKTVDANNQVPYTEHMIAARTRVRPTAYLMPRGLEAEEQILQVAAGHDISWYTLEPGSTVLVRRYRDVEGEVSLTEEYSHCFESGALVFPNTVTSTVLSVYMEPDFDREAGRKFGPVSMDFVAADENGDLPVFRYCHDLQDGKVEVR